MDRKPRAWGRIALVAVLGLSLLGNAVAVGAALRLSALRHDLLGPAADAALFPRDTRRAFREALSDHSDTLLPLLHRLAETRAGIVQAAARRPFDRAAVAAGMDRMRGETDALLAAVQAVLLDRLEAEAAKETGGP